ncbi:hypothetical protein [Rhodococcoides kyotonense]|uniref:Uncharacterized protein n=1 Tax=Rhodococcoides kyotonense TaxID=398843 RepID=A0A239J4A0_9NOCA|nr:hypothetical protein [Rhodococcus kyotonensis]SNT00298.1 hypothetical protein SAMN05421642_10830 [Rhodococcus kyotonensis]
MYPWSQFLWVVTAFVGLPTVVWAYSIRAVKMKEDPRADGLGLVATGSVAFLGGFVACAGWLSWSAYGRGPGLPAPREFPTWQVVACGITVVSVCFAAAHLSRWVKAGGLAAAAGATAGFTTAFSIDASTDDTGQAGVGILLSELGWGITLSILVLVRAGWVRSRSS